MVRNTKIVVSTIGTSFRDCTQLVSENLDDSMHLPPGHLLIQMTAFGVNASDVNFTAGVYQPNVHPPFDCGFEGMGLVLRCGASTSIKEGSPVVVTQHGSFSNFFVAHEANCCVVPSLDARYMAVRLSGLTAAISLAECGKPKSGEVALVTAAAGATGHIAVQLLKMAGCHVIGTCSTSEKGEMLSKLGCDQVVNYKRENLREVLRRKYPKGVNLIYESVGGDTLTACAENIAIGGRILLIGSIAGYLDGTSWTKSGSMQLPPLLLRKSASLHGFFLPHFSSMFEYQYRNLMRLVEIGSLKVHIDETFCGLSSVAAAEEHLHNGRNVGKVVVRVESVSSKL